MIYVQILSKVKEIKTKLNLTICQQWIRITSLLFFVIWIYSRPFLHWYTDCYLWPLVFIRLVRCSAFCCLSVRTFSSHEPHHPATPANSAFSAVLSKIKCFDLLSSPATHTVGKWRLEILINQTAEIGKKYKSWFAKWEALKGPQLLSGEIINGTGGFFNDSWPWH